LLAVNRLDVSDAGGVGFDLDGVCTCDKSPFTAYDGSASCRGSGGTTCDGEGGVDNAALANILKSFEVVQSLDQSLDVNATISAGNTTVLLLISEYNGRANDKEVQVALILSEGVNDGSGCPDSGNPNDKGNYAPKWCGKDIWTVDRDLVFSDAPPYQPVLATNGYVTNHRLVTRGDNRVYRMLFASAQVDLASPITIGTLTPLNQDLTPRDASSPPQGKSDRYFELDDGILAGRMLDNSLLEFAGSFPLPGNQPTYFCQSPFFAQIKTELCAARDIAASKSLDFDPNTPCGALSLAMRFTALPAVPGAALRRPPSGNPCVGPDAAASYVCPGDTAP
jgi:hypothetical protein